MTDEIRIPDGTAPCLQCPLGEKIHGVGATDGVFCRMERRPIQGRTGSASIQVFCTGEYTDNNHHRCPSYQTYHETQQTGPELVQQQRREHVASVQQNEAMLAQFTAMTVDRKRSL